VAGSKGKMKLKTDHQNGAYDEAERDEAEADALWLDISTVLHDRNKSHRCAKTCILPHSDARGIYHLLRFRC
jgi:hypothetical protein